jgi:hypothetical protein
LGARAGVVSDVVTFALSRARGESASRMRSAGLATQHRDARDASALSFGSVSGRARGAR